MAKIITWDLGCLWIFFDWSNLKPFIAFYAYLYIYTIFKGTLKCHQAFYSQGNDTKSVCIQKKENSAFISPFSEEALIDSASEMTETLDNLTSCAGTHFFVCQVLTGWTSQTTDLISGFLCSWLKVLFFWSCRTSKNCFILRLLCSYLKKDVRFPNYCSGMDIMQEIFSIILFLYTITCNLSHPGIITLWLRAKKSMKRR